MSEIDTDYDAPRGRQALIAVVVAVVFLGILGGGVGYLVGVDRRDKGNNVAGNGTAEPSPTADATGTPTVTPTGGGNGNGNGNGNNETKKPNNTKSYPPTTLDACPLQTAEAVGASASSDLNLVLAIRTARSEVWICQYQGRSFYQGHVRGRPFTSAISDSTILVNNVRYEAGVHAATNGSTVYYVSVERLRIEKDGKETANEAVEAHSGG
jgi:hypothetical protein